MIKKIWAKFNGMDIECVCDEHHRKCQKDDNCKEYVAKFIEVSREEEQLNDALKHMVKDKDDLRRAIQKFQSEVSRSIKKFKV